MGRRKKDAGCLFWLMTIPAGLIMTLCGAPDSDQPPSGRLADVAIVATATSQKSTPTRLRPTYTPTNLPPTSTPTNTATPRPIEAGPYVTAAKSVNLRDGPGTTYPVIGAMQSGDKFSIVGRNADRTWWQVNASVGLAWVSASVIEAINTDQSIPVPYLQSETEPTSTSTAVPTPTRVIIPTKPAAPAVRSQPAQVACCKHCGADSKPCGDSCISKSKTCHKEQGCACY